MSDKVLVLVQLGGCLDDNERLYLPGETLELPVEEARALEAAGTVRLVKPKASPASGGKKASGKTDKEPPA